MIYYIKTSNELYHYGMPRRSGRYPYGSGERPYQGDNDTVKRRASDMKTEDLRAYNTRRKEEDKYHQYQVKDRERELGLNKWRTASDISRKASDTANSMSRQFDEIYREEHRRQKANVDLSNMSDEELRRIVNRMDLERRYKDLMPVEISDGERKTQAAMNTIGSTLATAASVLGIVVGIKELLLRR